MSPTPSRAKLIFDEIMSGSRPAEQLTQVLARIASETSFLECKSSRFKLDRLSSTWSEAISGFANTEGGLLIWGADARRDPATGIEVVRPDPLSKALQWSQELRNRTLTAVNPMLPGIEIEPIVVDEGRGFVVCLVPQGKHKPYCASARDNSYYMRVGTSFKTIPPELLRALFYPATSPNMKLLIALRVPPSGETFPNISFGVSLLNKGTATADDVALFVRWSEPMRRSDGILILPGKPRSTSDGAFYWSPLEPIHPEQESDSHHFERVSFENPPRNDRFGVDATLYCRNQQPTRFSHQWSTDDLMAGGHVTVDGE